MGTTLRIKDFLVENGWLEKEVVKVGKSRKILLRLTKSAREVFGYNSQIPEYGSLVHEYWKRYYAQQFQEKGYEVSLEVPRKSSGRTDIVVVKDDVRIAIEVETGKSDFVRNVQEDLLSGFDKVLVVVTDKGALEKVEKELGKEGLVIPNRIEIILTRYIMKLC